MRVAVTGSTGLLGRAVVRDALALGWEVRALSSRSTTPETFWDAAGPIEHSVAVLADIDAVVHCAAFIPRDHGDVAFAARCLEVNAIGTHNLLRAAELAAVKRFVFVSGANTLAPRGELVREDDPVGCEYAPHYLGSKVLAEIYVRAALARGTDAVVVRPTSIYGPGMDRGVFVTFATRLAAGQPITLDDGGAFQGDFVWRDDVSRLLCQAVTSSHRGAVNIGAGEAQTLHDIAGILCEILQADPGLVRVAPRQSPHGRRGFAAVDLQRAREWFGFTPMTLHQGLSAWFGGRR